MVLQEFAPCPGLREFIRAYRLVHFEFENIESLPCKKYPPKPEHCLTFYPKDLEQVEYAESGKKAGSFRIVLSGQQTEVTNRYVGKSFLVIQVVFNPGALFRITGIPSHKLTNDYIDAEAVFSGEIRNINDRLNEYTDYNKMIEVIDKYLLNEIKRKSLTLHRIDRINSSLFSRDNLPTIDSLASETCLSVRQYERLFVERMGVSPKFYLKIIRFENAYRMKNNYPHLDWNTVALHTGYYDYQHLVKDYKDLTRKTPGEFYKLELSAPERLFGIVDPF
jgi:AraC-like DNA-binding protein